MTDLAEVPVPKSIPKWAWWTWAGITVLVPAVVSMAVQASGIFQKSRELDIKMIELGVGILRANKEEVDTRPARGWAVDVIEKYGGVNFSPEARKQLIEDPLSVNPTVLAALLPPAPSPSSPETSPPSNSVQAPSVDNGTGGWAAVGFRGADPASAVRDQLFTFADGKPITIDPPPGANLKASTDVFVRAKPAGWGGKRWTLEAGQCFEIAETQALSAGANGFQIWVRGATRPCDGA